MKTEILFVLALKDESQGEIEKLDCPVLYTGVGKVNAAISLAKELIGRPSGHPKYVINLGTAGSTIFKSEQIVNVDTIIQRDMNCSPICFPFATPFDNGPLAIELKVSHRWANAICGTGDSFVKLDANKPELYHIADMECFALAKVCQVYGQQFRSLKYITDNGDAEDWKANLGKASKALAKAAKELIERLSEI